MDVFEVDASAKVSFRPYATIKKLNVRYVHWPASAINSGIN